MELYINLVNKAVDFIEDNIYEQLSLSHISRHFYMSEYHFDRLFKVFTGKSIKQYILGRKLTIALSRLNSTNDSIINIAMDLGFEYPEVFSRAFKSHFGVSPNTYRVKKSKVNIVERALVIPRDLVNCQGVLTLKASYVSLEDLFLQGVSLDVDIDDPQYAIQLKQMCDNFINESKDLKYLNHDRLYSIVNCHGDNSFYTVFSGKEVIGEIKEDGQRFRAIPGGWYACFAYKGDIIDIRQTFADDLFRWIAIKEIELKSNGIGMVSIFDEEYIRNQSFKILIPIVSPKA